MDELVEDVLLDEDTVDELDEELVELVDVLVDSVDRVVDVDPWLVVEVEEDVLEPLEDEDDSVVELTYEVLLERVLLAVLEVVDLDPDADFVEEEP